MDPHKNILIALIVACSSLAAIVHSLFCLWVYYRKNSSKSSKNGAKSSGLNPYLVYEYALSFSHNELEEEDVVFFNHEFLQSMCVSIAKHRLEILKLAAKNKGLISRLEPVSRLVSAIKRTKRSLAEYMRAFALVIVNQRIRSGIGMHGNKWKGGANATLNREKTSMMGGAQGPLLLTNGTHSLVVPPPGPGGGVESLQSPTVFEHQKEEETKMTGVMKMDVEEIRWDAMFQDLNPT